MSSTSHLTITPTSETKIDKHSSRSNLRILPCDNLSNLLYLSSSPTTNSKYLYYVNAEPTRKQSTTIPEISTTNTRRKLSTISLSVPWYKRTRSSSEEKFMQKTSRMSRDRLLPLDKLFHNATRLAADADQNTPTNDLIPFANSLKVNEKNLQQIKENGFTRSSSQLVTRLVEDCLSNINVDQNVF